jgi:hypothetical protein
MPIPLKDYYEAQANQPGIVSEHRSGESIITRVCDGAIGFGRGVIDETDGESTVFDTAAGIWSGVALYAPQAAGVDDQTYNDGEEASVLRAGVVTVYSGEAVNPAADVRCIHTTVSGFTVGDFRATAIADKTSKINGARWAETTTAAGYVKLELFGGETVTADT